MYVCLNFKHVHRKTGRASKQSIHWFRAHVNDFISISLTFDGWKWNGMHKQ